MSDSKPYPLAELADYLRTRFPDVESARTPWTRKTPTGSNEWGIGYFRDSAVPFVYLSKDDRFADRDYTVHGGVMDPRYAVDDRYVNLFEWSDVWLSLIDACANRRGSLLPDPQVAGMRWALKKARDDDRERSLTTWGDGYRITATLPDVTLLP